MKTKVKFEELAKLFLEAASHLDYCGYGDSYEREGTKDLRWQINEMVDKLQAMGIKL